MYSCEKSANVCQGFHYHSSLGLYLMCSVLQNYFLDEGKGLEVPFKRENGANFPQQIHLVRLCKNSISSAL